MEIQTHLLVDPDLTTSDKINAVNDKSELAKTKHCDKILPCEANVLETVGIRRCKTEPTNELKSEPEHYPQQNSLYLIPTDRHSFPI